MMSERERERETVIFHRCTLERRKRSKIQRDKFQELSIHQRMKAFYPRVAIGVGGDVHVGKGKRAWKRVWDRELE